MRPAVRSIALLSATIVLAVVVAPAAAGASLPGSACPTLEVSQPFAHLGDLADYFLAPGGDFESRAAGWQLAGGAAVIADDAPAPAAGASGGMVLDLPAGSSATSPPICIAAEHRSLRFFANGPDDAELEVRANYVKRSGKVKRVTLGEISGVGRWAASDVIGMRVHRDADKYGGALSVSLTFAADDDEGGMRMDDLWIDPFRGR